ncbi:hypothetical protein G352_26267 [Rhodococcus ruber BKS 20-38]|uniref:Integral membrane protein n=1 Tax=Rhodococcus ruber BKS 20-38 TaxID=1278076 RepID=M2Y8P3_9NOCA|nr:hypothetical protein [Rhodococcus ruber]EME51302.1 hypothetical protein G352_26267 [Rhodococcus ruber BKS 20-38]
MRSLVRTFLAALLAVLALASSATPALAQPLSGAAEGWPAGMPDELKEFFPGHPEFEAAGWSTDPACADKGGDYGLYLGQYLRFDQQILYWASPVTQRIAQYADLMGVSEDEAKQAVLDGRAPTTWPESFPGGDETFSPPAKMCAADLAKWSEPSGNPWGFTWASKPDPDSIALMKQQQWVDNLPDDIFENPCSDHEMLCNRAYFLACDKATNISETKRCQAWNKQIGTMFGGIWNWKEQNKDLADRFVDLAKLGGVVLEAATPLHIKLGVGLGMAAVDKASDVVAFIADPGSVIDDWANSTKESAVSLTTSVLEGLANIHEFNPRDEGFLRWYAVSCGIGVFVMSITALFTIYRTSAQKSTRMELAHSLIGYAPLGVLSMMFAPAAAEMLVQLSHALTTSLSGLLKQDLEQAVVSVSAMLGGITSDTVVGGSLTGIVFFGLLFLGSLALFFGMLMHAAALPILAGLTGVAFGLWVHPNLRTKAMRPIFVFISIVFSKPVIFLGLGFLTTVLIDSSAGAYVDGELASLGALAMSAVCIGLVGLAPWSLLKYAPFMPSSEDSEGFGDTGSATGQGLGGTLQTAQMAMMARGGGGGGEVAAARSAGAAHAHPVGGGGAGGGVASTSNGSTSHSSAGSTSHQHSGVTAGHSGGGHGGASTRKLMGAAKGISGTAASAGVGAVVVAGTVGGAALNKAAQAAQNAPERAESMGDQ